ncbi:galactose transferase [Lacticaseibacillus rhamnosus]|nr:galactose transferase [Lacticaseibacillus rhamnosus]
MKKILYLHAGAEMYGADKILLELVEGIDKAKYKPIVLLPEDGVLVEAIANAGVEVKVIRYPIVRRKYFTPLGIWNFLLKYVYFSNKLVRFVKKEKIDIVHINTTAVWEGVWIKLFSKSKVIWHVHEIIMHPTFVFRVVSFLLEHFSNQIIAVSDATAERLLQSGIVSKNKISVIHNGIASEDVVSDKSLKIQNALGVHQDDIVIGMVGRVNSWKGQGDFIDAVIPVLNSSKNARAILIGSPYLGEEARLKELMSRINSLSEDLQNRIQVIPFQNRIQDYYAFIDIFVLPSTSPDPFPTVVLEAMANGIPVVGYAHGGVVEMVNNDKNGILVQPNNTNELSKAINRLVVNRELRERYGKESKIRQKKLFELSGFVESFEEIYNRV